MIVRQLMRICIALIILQASQAFCSSVQRWYTGDCKVYSTPLGEISIWPAACVQLQSESTLLHRFQEPVAKYRWQSATNDLSTTTQVYTGLHLNKILAIHARYFHIQDWSDIREKRPLHRDYWAAAFLQIGNPILQDWHGSFGLIDLPFGLDARLVSETIRTLKTDHYWHQRMAGGRITWIRHDRTVLEVGLGHTRSQNAELHDLKSQKSTWSFRLSKDLPALSGTKLALSYAREEKLFQSFGFASFNHSREGQTSFEWVRKIPLDDPDENFSQIFRLNYRSLWQKQRRWYFEYESERDYMWMLTLGYEYLLFKHAILNLETAYQGMTQQGVSSQWILGGGFKVHI
ncbi:MAG: hypothetical protein ACOH5I_04670 [Oligoflexus sp.]